MELRRRHFAMGLSALLARPACADTVSSFFMEQERLTRGHIGFYAQDLQRGWTLAWREKERFVMCSTFKMSLAACVLARADRQEENLDEFVTYGAADLLDYAPAAKLNLSSGGMRVADLCKAAVELSDNTCANLLLKRIGGPAGLTAFWRTTGDNVSRLDHNEPVLNRTRPGQLWDTTTPQAMAGNVRRFLLGDVLSPGARRKLIFWMLQCQTGHDLLRAGLPGWNVADKTGNNAADALGDIAMAFKPGRAMVIAVYTRYGATDTEPLRPIFADIGRLAGRRLG